MCGEKQYGRVCMQLKLGHFQLKINCSINKIFQVRLRVTTRKKSFCRVDTDKIKRRKSKYML